MRCIKCLFENRPGVSFCEQCGTRLSVIEPDETRCHKCGFVIRLGVKFYQECGARMEGVYIFSSTSLSNQTISMIFRCNS